MEYKKISELPSLESITSDDINTIVSVKEGNTYKDYKMSVLELVTAFNNFKASNYYTKTETDSLIPTVLKAIPVFIYISSTNTPNTPTGGSYDFETSTFTPPTDWLTSAVGLSNPIWYSSATFYSDGTSSSWTTPTYTTNIAEAINTAKTDSVTRFNLLKTYVDALIDNTNTTISTAKIEFQTLTTEAEEALQDAKDQLTEATSDYTTAVNKIDAQTETFNANITLQIDNLKGEISTLLEGIDTNAETLVTLTNRLNAAEGLIINLVSSINTLTQTVNNAGTSIDALNAKVSNYALVSDLYKGAINNVSTTLDGVNGKIENVASRVDTLNDSVNEVGSTLDALNNSLSLYVKSSDLTTGDIAKAILNLTLNQIEEKVATLTTKLNEVETNVSSLTIDPTSIAAKVSTQLENTLTSLVETQVSSLTMTEDEIKSLVTSTKTELSGLINTCASSIEQTNNSISATVLQTLGESTAKTTIIQLITDNKGILTSDIEISADKIVLDGTTFISNLFAEDITIGNNYTRIYGTNSITSDKSPIMHLGFNTTTALPINLFRRDGSGYLANNNLYWDSLGNLTIDSSAGLSVSKINGHDVSSMFTLDNTISGGTIGGWSVDKNSLSNNGLSISSTSGIKNINKKRYNIYTNYSDTSKINSLIKFTIEKYKKYRFETNIPDLTITYEYYDKDADGNPELVDNMVNLDDYKDLDFSIDLSLEITINNATQAEDLNTWNTYYIDIIEYENEITTYQLNNDGSISLASGNIICDKYGNFKLGPYTVTNDKNLSYTDYYTKLNTNGVLSTSNIIATGGTIGGWTISNSSLLVQSSNIESNSLDAQSPKELIQLELNSKGNPYIYIGYVPKHVTDTQFKYETIINSSGIISNYLYINKDNSSCLVGKVDTSKLIILGAALEIDNNLYEDSNYLNSNVYAGKSIINLSKINIGKEFCINTDYKEKIYFDEDSSDPYYTRSGKSILIDALGGGYISPGGSNKPSFIFSSLLNNTIINPSVLIGNETYTSTLLDIPYTHDTYSINGNGDSFDDSNINTVQSFELENNTGADSVNTTIELSSTYYNFIENDTKYITFYSDPIYVPSGSNLYIEFPFDNLRVFRCETITGTYAVLELEKYQNGYIYYNPGKDYYYIIVKQNRKFEEVGKYMLFNSVTIQSLIDRIKTLESEIKSLKNS